MTTALASFAGTESPEMATGSRVSPAIDILNDTGSCKRDDCASGAAVIEEKTQARRFGRILRMGTQHSGMEYRSLRAS